MTEKTYHRKLTAILSADVKGYSRLMGEDEVATIRTLEDYRQVVSNIITQHQGRVVDSPGDNVLAEFGSVVDAVQSAVEIQKELKVKNAELPETKRMEFRIGINLGDVVEQGERIYGDGVNIAARIEGLSEGGGICISGTAFDQVKNKLKLGYEYLGEHSVKNIAEPVRVYKVLTEPEYTGKVIGEEKPKPKQWRWAAIGALALLIVVVGIFAIWNFYLRPDVEPASVEKMAFPLPDKPSIAVLPFVNLSDDPEQEYFSDGLTDQIISTLSKFRSLFVISHSSTATYKGKPVKIQTVAEDLGVKYVLEGSVQRTADRIRITAQLIDAITGHHMWSQRYDREQKDIFAIQDDITLEITKALQVDIMSGEQARIWAKHETSDLEAFEKRLQADEYFFRFTKEDNATARRLYEEVIVLDPEYALAYVMLGWTYFYDARFGWVDSRAESIKMAITYAQKAMELNETQDNAYLLMGGVYFLQGRYGKAIAEAERAIALNPNGATNYSGLAGFVGCSGRWEESVALAKKSIRLHPFAPAVFYHWLGRAYFMTGQYDEAIATFKKILENNSNYLPAHAFLAACYSALDRHAEASAAVKEVLRLNPKFTLESYAKTLPYKNKADKELLINALSKAGLPETPPLPLPDKPSIAVLPFTNMSDDPKQEFFSDGISEEIITALSKTPKLFVIARNSTFTYKNKPTKVQQVGRELGVKYVLEGSVRKAGNKVRITAQLIDAQTGNHLWAERYDRELQDIFAIQDEITKKIITELQVKLTEGEHARVYAKGTENLNAFLKVMEANWLFSQGTKDGVLKARQLAEEAIALDSNYAFAYKVLGSSYGMAVQLGLSKNPRESLKRAIELFRKAIELDDSLAMAHNGLGYWSLYTRQYDIALAEGRRAFELEPNSAEVIMGYATILSMVGEPQEVIPLYKEALRLNPKPPNTYIRLFAIALRDSGQYEKAIVQARKAVRQEPNDLIANVVLVSSLSLAGQEEEARAAAKEIMRLNPNFSVAQWQKRSPQKDRAVVQRYCDALRKAGLPE